MVPDLWERCHCDPGRVQHVKLLYYIKISLSHTYGLLFGHQKAQEN
jgi:hypothetical protein